MSFIVGLFQRRSLCLLDDGRGPRSFTGLSSAGGIVVWDVALFLQQGLYERAVIKLQILLPPLFPHCKDLPIVRMLSKIVHPSLNDDRTFDLNSKPFNFRQIWRQHDRISTLLEEVWNALSTVTLCDIINVQPKEIPMEEKRHAAEHSVQECTRDADFRAFTQDSDDFSIRFRAWDDEQDTPHLERLLGRNS
eukprot:gene10007-2181_t